MELNHISSGISIWLQKSHTFILHLALPLEIVKTMKKNFQKCSQLFILMASLLSRVTRQNTEIPELSLVPAQSLLFTNEGNIFNVILSK